MSVQCTEAGNERVNCDKQQRIHATHTSGWISDTFKFLYLNFMEIQCYLNFIEIQCSGMLRRRGKHYVTSLKNYLQGMLRHVDG